MYTRISMKITWNKYLLPEVIRWCLFMAILVGGLNWSWYQLKHEDWYFGRFKSSNKCSAELFKLQLYWNRKLTKVKFCHIRRFSSNFIMTWSPKRVVLIYVVHKLDILRPIRKTKWDVSIKNRFRCSKTVIVF